MQHTCHDCGERLEPGEEMGDLTFADDWDSETQDCPDEILIARCSVCEEIQWRDRQATDAFVLPLLRMLARKRAAQARESECV